MPPGSRRLAKLPARYGAVVMPLILSMLMTCVISGISTVNALGLSAQALRDWPVAWIISWAVAFPTLILVLPVVRRIVAVLVAVEQPGVGTASGTEAAPAATATLSASDHGRRAPRSR